MAARGAWPPALLLASLAGFVATGALAAPAVAPSPAATEARPAASPATPLAASETPARIEVSPAIHTSAGDGVQAAAPRILLVTNGRDPQLLATIQQLLDQLGASVALVPMAPGDLVPGTSTASTGPRPAALPGGAATVPASPLSWEGQLRYRYETRTLLDYRLPGTFGRATTQSLADRGDVSLMRTRLGANLRLAPGVRGYFSLQDARTMGAEGSPSGTLANVDLYNAWVDLDSMGGRALTLRLGRQVLSYGDGRVLSGADWGNASRAYDGARARWSPARMQLDGFVAWINEGRLTGQDRVLSGLDALWRGPKGLEAEAYHFRRGFGDASWTAESGSKGALKDATTGLRMRGAGGALELRLEGAVQRGRRAGDPVRAWFGAGRVTADLHSRWKSRLFVERLRASGDSDPADGTFGRFDPVYWGGHGFQGVLDIAGESNLDDACAGLSAQPSKGWTVQSELHVFSLASGRDAWVDDAGTTLRRSSAGTAGTALGRECDASVRWDTRSRVSVIAGASRFWRGEFVRGTGGGSDVNWGYLQFAASF